MSLLAEVGMEAAVYSGIANEPTSQNVAEGVAAAAVAGADCVIAVGGGSAIDAAKAVAVLAVNEGLAFVDIASLADDISCPVIICASPKKTYYKEMQDNLCRLGFTRVYDAKDLMTGRIQRRLMLNHI